ncbi:polycystic kidney disease 2-like 2 protein isoform X2 [Daktulosphaira vitifoliae]|uniref:polycystic kidney disease 2-like 2 protein isoform X2 n=1 Tax=Daktulosphaira vitifoliae TaxID=58002 RepID=UPI0021AA055A|nr:polycystic kidney disease 2-like 2 protein isoform X2 [Daktulosphaira vitifoliae]
MVVITLIIIAFAVLGYCAFGAQVEGFSTISDSLMSALRILMRDFDYHSVAHIKQGLTTFFFITFTCIVIFVLLTMLMAIVFHAYFDVDIEEMIGKRKIYVLDKLSLYTEPILRKLDLIKLENGHTHYKAEDELNEISYQDFYKILKRCNYVDSEIENIIKQNNIQPQETIKPEKVKKLLQKLEMMSNSIEKIDKNDLEEIERLNNRVKFLNKNMDLVNDQINYIIASLNSIRASTNSL